MSGFPRSDACPEPGQSEPACSRSVHDVLSRPAARAQPLPTPPFAHHHDDPAWTIPPRNDPQAPRPAARAQPLPVHRPDSQNAPKRPSTTQPANTSHNAPHRRAAQGNEVTERTTDRRPTERHQRAKRAGVERAGRREGVSSLTMGSAAPRVLASGYADRSSGLHSESAALSRARARSSLAAAGAGGLGPRAIRCTNRG